MAKVSGAKLYDSTYGFRGREHLLSPIRLHAANISRNNYLPPPLISNRHFSVQMSRISKASQVQTNLLAIPLKHV